MSALESQRSLAWLLALTTLLSACSGGNDQAGDDGADPSAINQPASTTSSSPTTTPIDEGPKAPLTGLPADDQLSDVAAVVIKVSNNDDRSLAALVGLERADVVIEERIEDRATRFAAIFHSDLPDQVGPVRSGRSSDLDLLANLGSPILVFSGANIGVLGQLRDLAGEGRVVLVADDASGQYLKRDEKFARPDNLFVDPALVLSDHGPQAGTAQGILSFRTIESAPRPEGAASDGVTITGRDSVSFVYDPARGYVRVQDGAIHVTREGSPLVVRNVVIMETVYAPSQIAAGSVDAITIGSGPATVLIDGRQWAGTWSRATRDDGYTFSTEDGAEVLLEPGRTWLSLAPADSYVFAVDTEIAGLVLGGAG